MLARQATRASSTQSSLKLGLNAEQKRTSFEVSLSGGRSSVSGVVATVFGCTGFLGRHIVNGLGRRGSQVVIPYRGEEKSYNHLKVMGDVGQIVPMQWDIRDKDSMRRAAEYSNVIINVVGSRYDTRNFTMRDVHVDGARMIAEVAKEVGAERFIHVSALSANTLSSDWGKTKWEGEQAVRSVFPEATIIRPATLWGPQDQFLNHHASMMRYWPVYPIVHPEKRWQPVYVDDVAQGIINTLKTEDSVGNTYEFAGPTILNSTQLGEWMAKILKLEDDKYRVNISDEMLWHLGYWLGQHRRPRFTLDTIKENTDIVASLKFPGLESLGIEPVSIKSQLALSMVYIYRYPARQDDITLERGEIPDIEGSVAAGRPAY